MIGRLRGELVEIAGTMATIDCGGVGYEVHLPDSVLSSLPSIGETVELRIRQVIREDASTLYGFVEPFQRRLFDLLTEVKGCGPKISLALLGQIGEQAVVGAILTGDAKALSRASGVGPRLAERVILELKDRIGQEAAMDRIAAAVVQGTGTIHRQTDEALEALVALGYRRSDAEAALLAQDTESIAVEDRIRTALRSLAK